MHLPWDKRGGKSGCVDKRVEVVIADDLYVYSAVGGQAIF